MRPSRYFILNPPLNKTKPKCSNCGAIGHTLKSCYQIIGHPPGWQGARVNKRFNQHGSTSNNTGGVGHHAHAAMIENNVNSQFVMSSQSTMGSQSIMGSQSYQGDMTLELYNQFLQFTKFQAQISHPSSHVHKVAVAISEVPSTSHEQGAGITKYALSSIALAGQNAKCILDIGATDHDL